MIALFVLLAGQAAPTKPAAGVPVVVPKGTEIQLAIAHALSSKTNKVGDTVEYLVAEDVKDAQGHVIIPQKTTVEGTVTAVEGQAKIDHLRGLLGIQAKTLHLPSGQDVQVNIEVTDKQHGDFRTRDTIVPPQATKPEAAKFYASGQPAAAESLVTTVANNATAKDAMVARGAGSGASGHAAAATIAQDPLEENSAVLLSQIVDFKQSQSLVQGLGGTNLAIMIRTLSNHQDFAQFTRTFSLNSAVSVVGAGVGLYKLACVGHDAFFKHCSIAPGALFTATTTASSTVNVDIPMVARDKWNRHRKLLKPRRFAHRANQRFVPDGKRHMKALRG